MSDEVNKSLEESRKLGVNVDENTANLAVNQAKLLLGIVDINKLKSPKDVENLLKSLIGSGAIAAASYNIQKEIDNHAVKRSIAESMSPMQQAKS
ncbi:hypothetical protein GAY33_14685 [Azospirillum brasilense]|uniref:hypothetical protein n=1 Tax=Azospirillum argentinense TaxID=2970906 RepID=UPI00190DEB13|nr:hypothetical protein [Azospirillum argentinense]MBK3800465.1 hypothetical protein [Azospirillum argentinense]